MVVLAENAYQTEILACFLPPCIIVTYLKYFYHFCKLSFEVSLKFFEPDWHGGEYGGDFDVGADFPWCRLLAADGSIVVEMNFCAHCLGRVSGRDTHSVSEGAEAAQSLTAESKSRNLIQVTELAQLGRVVLKGWGNIEKSNSDYH